MTIHLNQLGLSIESPIITPRSKNFRPTKWPPPNDFPIVIDEDGKEVSRYGDIIWNLRAWSSKPVILNFCDGVYKKAAPKISPQNAKVLRIIAAWWIYGPMGFNNATSLRGNFMLIRPLFVECSKRKILILQLNHHAGVFEEYCSRLSISMTEDLLRIFRTLHDQRDSLGFSIVDKSILAKIESSLGKHESRQTPYIPPRIWTYQVCELRKFLDDFHLHKEKIEACYHFCLNAYVENMGSLAMACQISNDKPGPFWMGKRWSGTRGGKCFLGTFWDTAKRFGIDELLERWCSESVVSVPRKIKSIGMLSKYFSMVSYVGVAYIANFTLMRIDEIWSLRSDCFGSEFDERFGTFHFLRGPTTKTIEDDNAIWPTSPSVKVAVDAMVCVARLRMICAEANPVVPTTEMDIQNPRLVVRPHEPWGTCAADEKHQSLSVKAQPLTYCNVFKKNFPGLFDFNELQIAQSDLDIARFVNPSLDAEKYSLHEIWSLAWHQLRRTGAVNMQASGLVSDSSLQYLLKHSTRAMSLFYGQGYSRLGFNNEAKGIYVRAMYEVIGKEISLLFNDRFVSPHGIKRKMEILKIVDKKDVKILSELAREGKISWRETLLGGCTKRGPCPYGGVDNVARCGGGDGEPACADALYDRERVKELNQLTQVIESRIKNCNLDSPNWKSLMAQKLALRNALNVIKKYQ